jgi:hypothetical protein
MVCGSFLGKGQNWMGDGKVTGKAYREARVIGAAGDWGCGKNGNWRAHGDKGMELKFGGEEELGRGRCWLADVRGTQERRERWQLFWMREQRNDGRQIGHRGIVELLKRNRDNELGAEKGLGCWRRRIECNGNVEMDK